MALLPLAAMIENARSIKLQQQRLWLLPQKAIYWPKKKMLLVADLHVGKAGHFRKNGIPVPQQVNKTNFDILDHLIEELEAQQIIFLGDLFHSNFNNEWRQLKNWRKKHPNIEITLVIGNHDILSKDQYHASHISVFKRLKMPPFYFLHDIETAPNSIKNSSLYILGGHLHPALQLKGKGRQRMKFPCFYFGKDAGILPAFGQFTGTAIIHPEESARTFLIIDEQVLSTTNKNH